MKRLTLSNFGPIAHADVELADLTVCVGPQATGKSLFWQTLKLALDAPHISNEMRKFNIEWGNDETGFLELYFGEGMQHLVSDATEIGIDGKPSSFGKLMNRRGSRDERNNGARMFYIPAQRIMAIRDGLTRPFTDYRTGDPFVIREFSERLHILIQGELASLERLFPATKRLSGRLRTLINEGFYRDFTLQLSKDKFQKKLVLKKGDTELPFLTWSAGQREFTPLLLGLYWLMPAGKVSRRDNIQWAVIEEPEMGLHPKAISSFMIMVLELLRRGYKVCLSTHSPHILDVVWGLQTVKELGGERDDIIRMLEMGKTPKTKEIADTAQDKSYAVHYFSPDGQIRNISSLDPGADDNAIAGWGGLSEFSGHVGDVVADVVNKRGDNGELPE